MLMGNVLDILQDKRTMISLPVWSCTFVRPYNPYTPLSVYENMVNTDTIKIGEYVHKLSTMLYSRNNGKTWHRLPGGASGGRGTHGIG